MATGSIVAALRVLQPAVKAIPVAGDILDGVIGSVFEIYQIVERLKTNHQQAKDLADRVGRLSLTLARMPPEQLGSISKDLDALKTLLDETIACVKLLDAKSSKNKFLHWAKEVTKSQKDNEELLHLDKKVTEAVECFNVAKNVEDLAEQSREKEAEVKSHLLQILEPVFGSDADLEGCLEGTRVSLVEDLLAWISSDSSERIVWLSGMAGTGKSSVAKTICDYLHDHIQDAAVHLAMFFISHDVPARREPSRILHTLLYFIARFNFDFGQRLHRILCARPELISDSLDRQSTHLLKEPLAHCANSDEEIIIVIDALDECHGAKGEGDKLLHALLPLVEQSQLRIRLVVTARPEASIDRVFSAIDSKIRQCWRIDDTSALQQDVTAYFSFHFPNLSPRQIQSLSAKANGLFIYAATVVRFVKFNELFDELELLRSFLQETSAPEEDSVLTVDYGPLDDVYLRVLRTSVLQVPAGVHHAPTSSTAARNLQASAHLVRSVIVTLASLHDYVSPSTLARLMDRTADQIEKVLKRLSAVLTIDASGTIRLLHLSFSEFILNPRRCTDPLFHPNGQLEGRTELADIHFQGAVSN